MGTHHKEKERHKIVQGHSVSNRDGYALAQSLSVPQLAPALTLWSVSMTQGGCSKKHTVRFWWSFWGRETWGFRGWWHSSFGSTLVGRGGEGSEEREGWAKHTSRLQLMWKWKSACGKHTDLLTPVLMECSGEICSLSTSRQEKGFIPKYTSHPLKPPTQTEGRWGNWRSHSASKAGARETFWGDGWPWSYF